jgi:hypothetical protein
VRYDHVVLDINGRDDLKHRDHGHNAIHDVKHGKHRYHGNRGHDDFLYFKDDDKPDLDEASVHSRQAGQASWIWSRNQ